MSQPKIKSGILDTGTGANQVVALNAQGELPAIPSTLTKFKTTDTARNSTDVLTNDPHLSGWVLEANTYYSIEGYITLVCPTTVGSPVGYPDVAFRFTSSTAPQDSAFCFSSDMTGGDVVLFEDTKVVGGALPGSPVVGVGYGVVGFVYTNASTSPTVDFQWAQDVPDIDDSILQRGSWIRFTKMS